MRNTPIVSQENYFDWLALLADSYKQFYTNDHQAIVCLKRSGFIMGVYLSHKLGLPLFTISESDSIPAHFTKLLLVDDKVCTGKSMKKAKNKLVKTNKEVTTCTLFYEAGDDPTPKVDWYAVNLGKTHKMFYEV